MVLHRPVVELLPTVAGYQDNSHIFHYLFLSNTLCKIKLKRYTMNIPVTSPLGSFPRANQIPHFKLACLSYSEHMSMSNVYMYISTYLYHLKYK